QFESRGACGIAGIRVGLARIEDGHGIVTSKAVGETAAGKDLLQGARPTRMPAMPQAPRLSKPSWSRETAS
ncbi:MAG: hypothetical protein J7516_13835, partial [Shinella sp.]|nr:hypothetical protein [Shinella sp.]